MSEFTPEDWEAIVSKQKAQIAELEDALQPFANTMCSTAAVMMACNCKLCRARKALEKS